MADDHKYDDIIHLPHHTSKTHPRMSMIERAAQFSPFAALTGYDSVIKEVGRFTEQKVELGESEIEELERALNQLTMLVEKQPKVAITYFQPDSKKEGGAYIKATGCLKQIDEYNRTLILADGMRIPIGDITDIEFDSFHCFDQCDD